MPGSGHFKVDYVGDSAVFPTPFRRFWVAVLLVIMLVLPLALPKYGIHLVNLVMLASISTLMLNVLTGYTGIISLGQGGFLAAGGFTAALLDHDLGVPFVVSVIAAAVVGALLGAIAALPALRLKGIYLILSTVAMFFIVTLSATVWQSKGGNTSGIPLKDASLGFMQLANSYAWYYFLLFAVVVITVGTVNLLRTRIGRTWIAIRDRDVVAKVLGVNVGYYRILAFVFTAGVTAAAGALEAFYMNFAVAEQYTLWLSISFIAMVMIGGAGSVAGSFLGAALVILLPYGLSGLFDAVGVPPRLETYFYAVQFALFGLLLMMFTIVEPGGLIEIWRRIRTYFELFPFKYYRPPTTVR